MFSKSSFAGFMAILGLLFFVSCGVNKQEKINAQDELVVGLNSGFPPYEVLNSQGQFEGFDIDVANQIAIKMGKKLVIKDMAFDALIMSLKQEKIDLIISGVSISPHKLQEIDMVHYQGDATKTIGLYFWEKIPAGVSNITDLKHLENKNVYTQAGMTVTEDFLVSTGGLDVTCLENIADLVMALKYGKAIAVALDVMIGNALKKQSPELVMLEIALPEKYHSFGYGIGIKKNKHDLKAQVNKIILELKNNKTLTQLEQKWFAGGSHANS